jgi:hypothetical protein
VHLSVLIISQRILLQTLLHLFVCDYDFAVWLGIDHKFQNIQQLSGIAAAISHHGGSFLHIYFALLQFFVVMYGVVYEFCQIFFLERLECIYLTARKQRTYYLERRILRGCADKCYRSVFHGSEQ